MFQSRKILSISFFGSIIVVYLDNFFIIIIAIGLKRGFAMRHKKHNKPFASSACESAQISIGLWYMSGENIRTNQMRFRSWCHLSFLLSQANQNRAFDYAYRQWANAFFSLSSQYSYHRKHCFYYYYIRRRRRLSLFLFLLFSKSLASFAGEFVCALNAPRLLSSSIFFSGK